MLSIGLMSGTSMDGIDAALIDTDGEIKVIELADSSINYEPEFKILLKAAEFAVREKAGDLSAAKKYYPQAITRYIKEELNLSLNPKLTSAIFDEVVEKSTLLHAQLVKQLLQKTKFSPTQIDVIGYHGQTLFHHPNNKITIQIGDGQLLADQTGIKVVNDFRSQDVAAGGQGAPLAPLYHQALAIRDAKYPAAVINCGGIANITIITGAQADQLSGFDTGPGNGLIDQYIKLHTQGRECMDTDGKYGQLGKIDEAIIQKFYATHENFFARKPPKSLDIADFKLVPDLHTLSLADACATLEAFTADAIVKSIDHLNCQLPTYWVLAGGGWKNPVIRRELEKRLYLKLGRDICILTADEAGWNSQYMEAQIFAYLAVRSLQNKPISFPTTTCVPKPLTGGHLYIPR